MSAVAAVGVSALVRVIAGHPGRARRWIVRAACVGVAPEVFTEARSQSAALAVCNGCPVLEQCRADALGFDRTNSRLRRAPVGVVGGMTGAQRKAVHAAETRDRALSERAGGQGLLFAVSDLQGWEAA
jgi:WhiB family redox-sensing transcriptional regulator